MTIEYLKGRPWSEWTREERFFCSVLYHRAAPGPRAFAKWVIQQAKLDLNSAGDWDLGYEVCLYRDVLWRRKGPTAKEAGLPPKRTFDLCLFGEAALIILEAKAFEGFTTKQLQSFSADRKDIQKLPDMKGISVNVVALASSDYLENCTKSTREYFDGVISWDALYKRFDDIQFDCAEKLYGAKRGTFCKEPQ